ncbi:MAG TPA: FtsW/RodA/SpoVE family cell cycle protein [Deinococcales bacterium]|nr:FtsW/RodA/SpoVE family cell cycle protein [Deinococcales bacterium]
MNLPLLLAQLTLMALGLVGVSAAQPGSVLKHASDLAMAFALTLVVARTKPTGWIKIGPFLWGLAVFLLLAALVIGHGPNGVRRWIDLGPMEIQPSEFAKIAMIAYLASFFTRRGAAYALVGPIVVILMTVALIAVAPSLSAGAFVFLLALAVMFASGVGLLRIFSIIVLSGGLSILAVGFYSRAFPYVGERLSGYASIRNGTDDALGDSFQLHQSLRSLELGGLWGRGPDAPMPTVPFAHTDMIIASIGHATGLIGVSLVILAFWVVMQLGWKAATLVSDGIPDDERERYGQRHGAAVLAAGATALIVGQAVANLAVVIGLIPNTGMTLPMVSDGGSSMMAAGVAFGWIHSALREANRDLPALRRDDLTALSSITVQDGADPALVSGRAA